MWVWLVLQCIWCMAAHISPGSEMDALNAAGYGVGVFTASMRTLVHSSVRQLAIEGVRGKGRGVGVSKLERVSESREDKREARVRPEVQQQCVRQAEGTLGQIERAQQPQSNQVPRAQPFCSYQQWQEQQQQQQQPQQTHKVQRVLVPPSQPFCSYQQWQEQQARNDLISQRDQSPPSQQHVAQYGDDECFVPKQQPLVRYPSVPSDHSSTFASSSLQPQLSHAHSSSSSSGHAHTSQVSIVSSCWSSHRDHQQGASWCDSVWLEQCAAAVWPTLLNFLLPVVSGFLPYISLLQMCASRAGVAILGVCGLVGLVSFRRCSFH